MKLTPITSILAAFSIFCGDTTYAAVQLPPVISDHMVLQRDTAAPIWGTAAAGEEVTVSIAGQSKRAAADADGKWSVKLDPLKVSTEGLTLTVKGANTIEVKDVLVGEVWLGSGQSNMAGIIRGYKVNDDVLKKIGEAAPYPQVRLMKQSAGWQEATPANVDNFSAILFAFGARLQAELDVPVGLLLGAVGGTPSGHWLTEEMYRGDAAAQAQLKEFAATYDIEVAKKNHERLMVTWKANAEKLKAEGKPVGREPAAPTAPGVCAGVMGHLYVKHVQPLAPYAIRGVLWDQGESGTAITGADQFHVMGALISGWRKVWDQDFAFLYVQKPSGGGTAWDMENPVTKNASPFAATPAVVPRDIDGLYRELHIKIQQHPRTAMVISTDLGGMTHPTNKSGYGERAKQVALGFVYGKKVEISGPLYASHKIADGKVRIQFTHTGQGLAARHADKLQGFMIAGAERKFVWADAVIDGDDVVVSSPTVPEPAAVRYAWSNAFPWANLFNKNGLPAQTFRTDNWAAAVRPPASPPTPTPTPAQKGTPK
jgi:sialate O-acetylesterase